MALDVGFKLLDLIALLANDVLDNVANRHHAQYFAVSNNRQMPNVARSHGVHAFVEFIGKRHRHRVFCHDAAQHGLLGIPAGQQHLDGAIALRHDAFESAALNDHDGPDFVALH